MTPKPLQDACSVKKHLIMEDYLDFLITLEDKLHKIPFILWVFLSLQWLWFDLPSAPLFYDYFAPLNKNDIVVFMLKNNWNLTRMTVNPKDLLVTYTEIGRSCNEVSSQPQQLVFAQLVHEKKF